MVIAFGASRTDFEGNGWLTEQPLGLNHRCSEVKSQVASHLATDDHALNLAAAFVDLQNLGSPHQAGDGIFF
jgi:hypothetical protein